MGEIKSFIREFVRFYFFTEDIGGFPDLRSELLDPTLSRSQKVLRWFTFLLLCAAVTMFAVDVLRTFHIFP